MNKKIRMSLDEAKEITLREKKTMDDFHKKHFLNSKDLTTVLLKSHLYIENCLDSILSAVLIKPQRIIDKRFSDKIDFFESLNLNTPSSVIVNKIRIINKLRNEFVHDLNKELNQTDIEPLLDGIKHDKNMSLEEKLYRALQYVIGYLHCIKVLNNHFPFFLSCMRNESIFTKDDGYSKEEIKKTYPLSELKEILENMKM